MSRSARVRPRHLIAVVALGLLAACNRSAQPPRPVATAPADESASAAEPAAPHSGQMADVPPGPDERTTASNAGGYVVGYTSRPDPIPLNEPFELTVEVRRAGTAGPGPPVDGAALTVDGRMPEHRHGMNVVPEVRAIGDGRFTVTDMLFHMPGRWELHFDVTESGVTERAQFTVHLK
jgi:hypothetical protein